MEFVDADLRGARFIRSDLSGAVMRGVDLSGADLDAPWLLDGQGKLLVNGVDVAPLVDTELDRRFPGRALRRATDPEGLRAAWQAVESAWSAAVDRVAAMPSGSVDVSIDGEWSFAETLRHLIMATDAWLRCAILGVPQPFHPLGIPNAEYEADGHDMSVFALGPASFDQVREARADRTGMVRNFIAEVTTEDLCVPRANPWDPSHAETTLTCLQVILDEEWEHLRFAMRDLDALGQLA